MKDEQNGFTAGPYNMAHTIWLILYGPYYMVHTIWSILYGVYCTIHTVGSYGLVYILDTGNQVFYFL